MVHKVLKPFQISKLSLLTSSGELRVTHELIIFFAAKILMFT